MWVSVAKGQDTLYTPGGYFDQVYDRFGNMMLIEDLQIIPNGGGAAQGAPICQSGYFVLHFEPGCGMELNTQTHQEFRTVICKVFQDISDFLPQPAGSQALVHIRVMDITNIPNITPGTLGVASGYFSVPANQANGCVVDNQVQKTIIGGVDAWANVAPPLTGGNLYHGFAAFNTMGFIWHRDLATLATGLEHDFYTVALHEATHALGFGSLISQTGASGLNVPGGAQYYSRYDHFLRNFAGQYLLDNNGNTCSLYDYTFTGALTDLAPNPLNCISNHTDCNAAVHFYSLGLINQEVYTPNCWENGSSLSHFEDECLVPTPWNDGWFVMSNENPPASNKRHYTPDERTALCLIGYRVNTLFGDASVHDNPVNYGGTPCPGIDVAGVNDGLSNGTYTIVLNQNVLSGAINILGNDYNASGYECLEPIVGGGIVTPTAGNATFTYLPTTAGLHLLRYVPVSTTTNERGNVTYVFIWVISGTCPPPAACNLIPNSDLNAGTFCYIIGINSTVSCWETLSDDPDRFYRQCPFLFGIPTNVAINNPPADTWDNAPQNAAFIGLYSRIGLNNGNANTNIYESVQASLGQTLPPSQNYTATIRARIANVHHNGSFEGKIDFVTTTGVMGPQWTNLNANTYPGNYPNLHSQGQFIVPDDGQWHLLTLTFQAQQSFDVVGLINTSQHPERYIFIDDVTLSPVGEFNLDHVCVGSQPFDLAPYANPSGGTFSGVGVILNGNVYSFDPAIAGVGAHQLIYTYTNNLGCEVTIAENVNVLVDCCWGPEYIEVGSELGIPSVDFALDNGIFLLGANGELPSNIAVRGQFHINQTGIIPNVVNAYRILNGDVAMAAGAEMVIDAEAELYLNSTHVHDCGTFWRSITVTGGGMLDTKSSTVEGAEYCVRAENGSQIYLGTTVFQRFHRGVYAPAPPNVTGQTVNFDPVFGCTFRTGIPSWPLPYAGQPGSTSIIVKRMGVELRGLSYFVIGDPNLGVNLFEDLPTGILLSLDGHIVLQNSRFINVENGIKSTGITNGASSLDIFGLGHDNQTMFEHTQLQGINAIEAGRTALNINEVWVQGYSRGVTTSNNQNWGLNITHNRFYCGTRGLDLGQVHSVLNYTIHSITNNEVTVTATGGVGIDIFGAALYASHITLSTNEVAFSGQNGIGIRLTNVVGASLLGNIVNMNTLAGNGYYGIALFSSSYCQVECNSVDAITAGTNPLRNIAFNFDNSPNCIIDCNASDGAFSGYRFVTDNSASEFRGNNIFDHQRGLWHQSGPVKLQNNRKNLWLGNYAPGGPIGAFGINLSNTNFEFKVDGSNPDEIPGSIDFPPGQNSPNWFNSIGLSPTGYTCSGTSCGNAPVLQMVNNRAALSDEEYRFAATDPIQPEYSEEINWTADKAIYEKLFTDSIPLTDPLLEAFVESHTQQPLGKLADVQIAAANTAKPTEQENAELIAYQQQISTVKDQLAIQENSLSQAVTDEEKNLIRNQKAALVQILTAASAGLGQVMEAIQNSKAHPMELLLAENGQINATALYEQNEKGVNDIFLTTVAVEIDTFTVEQLTILQGIAFQCPALGGPAVHKARSLYALVADEVYLDDDVCTGLGVQMRQQETTEESPKGITVFPNPTNGMVTVSVAKGVIPPTQLFIYNLYGKEVGYYSMESEMSSFMLPIGQLEQGIYWIKFIDSNDGVIDRVKIALIK